jgi:hypothetical protein
MFGGDVLLIKSSSWLLVEKFKKEREDYENYTNRVTGEKIDFAKNKTSEVDLKILKLIGKLKMCTSSQVAKYIYQTNAHRQKYCNTHLQKLFQLGCIDRFFPAVEKGSPQTHIVLAPIGAKVIGIDNFRKITTLNQNWRHTIQTNEVLCEIISKYKVLNYKIELPIEWEEKQKEKKLRVDLFCGFLKNNQKHYIMVEVDLGTEPMSTLYKKIKNYESYFSGQSFKKDYWQPMKKQKISVIPSILFALNENNRAQKLSNFIKSTNTNLSIHVQNINDMNI